MAANPLSQREWLQHAYEEALDLAIYLKKTIAVTQPPNIGDQAAALSALVEYAVVVLATSEKDARAHVATWEHAWDSSSDLVGVVSVELSDVRGLKATDWRDEAHECTAAATPASSPNKQISGIE